jgi:hypothetical protein
MCWRSDAAAPLLAALLLFSCGLLGCAGLPSWAGGQGEELVLNLDREFETEAELKPDKRLVLDMRDPTAKGYVFAGTLFDPKIANLESFLPEGGRARAVFRTLKPGETVITVRIKRPADKVPDTYKRVKLKVAE